MNKFNTIDLQAIKQLVIEKNEIDKIGGFDYLLSLTESISLSSDFKTYIDILKDAHQKRRIIQFGRYCEDTATSNKFNGLELVGEVVKGLQSSIIEYGNAPIISPSQFLNKGTKAFHSMAGAKKISTGFGNLDNLIFMSYKELSSIIGRPGSTKSSLKCNIINNLCKNQFGVISIATEQTTQIELIRHVATLTDTPVKDFLRAKKDDDDNSNPLFEKFNQIMDYIDNNWNFHLITSRNMTVNKMKQFIMQILLKYPIDITFIDLFDKLIDVNVAEGKADNVSVKLGAINSIAEELNIHICILAQANRELEKRKDKHPMMSDIKGSGAYEEISRIVLGLYRDRTYNPDVVDDIVECTVIKQNNGPFGPEVKAKFYFDENTLLMQPIE